MAADDPGLSASIPEAPPTAPAEPTIEELAELFADVRDALRVTDDAKGLASLSAIESSIWNRSRGSTKEDK